MTRAISNDGNPQRAAAGWPSAVIAGASRTGVLGMRSLHRRGVTARCFDIDPQNPGFRSKYGHGDACPDPDTAPDAWVSFMIELAGKTGGKPVLIASADQFVSAIADHADALAPHFTLSPGVPIQGLLATKQTQYRLAADHGMPMPGTRFATSIDDATAFANSASFPCLVKPIHFREWRAFPDGHPLSYAKIAISETPERLIENWKLASAVNPNVILQEIIQGPDTSKRVYVSCYDRASRRIGNALFRETPGAIHSDSDRQR